LFAHERWKTRRCCELIVVPPKDVCRCAWRERAMPAEPVTLEVAYTYVEQFEQFVVSIQDYYSLFSWEEAPLHEIVYPLSTGVIYTLLVLLWATCREKPYPPGSAEAKHVAMELKQTDNALKPFVGACAAREAALPPVCVAIAHGIPIAAIPPASFGCS